MDTLIAVIVGIVSVLVIVCSCVHKVCAGPPGEAQPHARGAANGGGAPPPARIAG